MTESTVRPDIIKVDKVKNGKASLLCAWDIVEEQRTDPETETTTIMYVYQSGWIQWAIQEPSDDTKYIESISGKQHLTAAGIAYIETHTEEILQWIKPACRC